MSRIILAMSGGVDSSVAASLLDAEGWEVVGVTFDLWREGQTGEVPLAVADARAVCERLGIEHRTVDFRDEFRNEVVAGFCNEYFSGRTPNPCVVCNPRVKFALLERLAHELDAEAISTGHYARVNGPDCSGRCSLRKGAAGRKEQSYVLYGLSQRQLALAHFPLGTRQKAEVRVQAEKQGFAVHNKPDSQEICFIPDNDYGAFLAREAPERIRPGALVDSAGKELGRHEGIHRFTIGQRRGLGIAVGEPRYVLRIDVETATVVVGTLAEAFGKSFSVRDVNWTSVACPNETIRAEVKIRYNHFGAPAQVEPLADSRSVFVKFDQPQNAITPGQAAVFYDGDLVLGGGVIEGIADF